MQYKNTTCTGNRNIFHPACSDVIPWSTLFSMFLNYKQIFYIAPQAEAALGVRGA